MYIKAALCAPNPYLSNYNNPSVCFTLSQVSRPVRCTAPTNCDWDYRSPAFTLQKP